jgi:hypothetical protein
MNMNRARVKDILIDIGYTLEVIRGALPAEVGIGQERHFQHIQIQLWKLLTKNVWEEEVKAGVDIKSKITK